MARHLLSLESLEGRYLPAAPQSPAPAAAGEVAPGENDRPATLVLGTLSRQDAVRFGDFGHEGHDETGGFASPQALPDALLGQLALQKAAALMFPKSGGAGQPQHIDQVAMLMPAGLLQHEIGDETPDGPMPGAEQGDAESAGDESALPQDRTDGAAVEALEA